MTKKEASDIVRVEINGEFYLKISNHDQMRPFLMSIVSDSNHWMFISSNGGLTAGRKNAEFSLFPYYTDDKLTELSDTTGSKSIFWVSTDDGKKLWEPFSERMPEVYSLHRNLYKNVLGNKVLFEEENQSLGLVFRYEWKYSNQYGFIRESSLTSTIGENVTVSLIDGIQNIMPFGVAADFQMIRSNLVDAYKRSELVKNEGIGIYALSAIIVDKAEPSEALKANIAWSYGLNNPQYLLSSQQLDDFRSGDTIEEEYDIKAEKGAYLLSSEIEIKANQISSWTIVANVNQTASDIAEISTLIQSSSVANLVNQDVELGSLNLRKLVAASDGLVKTADDRKDTRHYSNTLFNIMRGGVFDSNYQIEKWDFIAYLNAANKEVSHSAMLYLETLPERFTYQTLQTLAKKSGSSDFLRLSTEYLPLKFSRRHGDPSRPWNKFSINTTSQVDGSKILDYEGNWRDIFQNWEALAHSYPFFIEGMIFKFLNASTFDGYNPYRITKEGIDWEVIEEDDPWSYIGYWGDHQIIYLCKFLEFAEAYFPGQLSTYFSEDIFVFANVPYRIKPYDALLTDPKDTIDFDFQLDLEINKRRKKIGSDGALLLAKDEGPLRVCFVEKILATVLAKLSNFIPEAGIWLNTQRPEWNDANNALVGNGVSMVTLCYLRRFMALFQHTLEKSESENARISKELTDFFYSLKATLKKHQPALQNTIGDQERKEILDGLGLAGSEYRTKVYRAGFSEEKLDLPTKDLIEFCTIALEFLDHSILANKRPDGMYHAYNIISTDKKSAISVSHLSEMLEGQVAVLSAGKLTSKEAVAVLDGMKQSALFREDQYSYLLYPNKELPGFLEKNKLSLGQINRSALLQKLEKAGDKSIVIKDLHGTFNFNGNFRNAKDLSAALKKLPSALYADLVQKEHDLILGIFEEVFNHKAFTGRSGTFYGYEGLGSIYWHMVSKLLLAVAEACRQAIDDKEDPTMTGRLLAHFYEIMEGIGVHKSPSLYGAFPTDPYSHTPLTKGAQQPGMTGQVKEDLLCRRMELGLAVEGGKISFSPKMLRKAEFLSESTTFEYFDISSKEKEIGLKKGELAFTICQVPLIYQLQDESEIEVKLKDGQKVKKQSAELDHDLCKELFLRTGRIEQITVKVLSSDLK
ncbi:MAG: hypothetical protein AAF616_04720 [Bacteroidota bacterium]